MLDRKKCQAYTVVNLILKKISKIRATRCQILPPKSISAGAPPQTPLENLQRPPVSLAVFKGAYF